MSGTSSCEFCELTSISKDILLETPCWKIVLGQEQSYLGRCVVVLKRHAGFLSDVDAKEWAEFHGKILPAMEAAARERLGADMFNWSCLMNLAWSSVPPNPHVHWHFHPRYRQPVELAGRTFADAEFGAHYLYGRQLKETGRLVVLDDDLRSALRERLLPALAHLA